VWKEHVFPANTFQFFLNLKLWPIRPNEFIPERTFQWERFVYLIINGREIQEGILPNILVGDYIEQIEYLENDIPNNVNIKLMNGWRDEIIKIKNSKENTTELLGKDGLLHFEVNFIFYYKALRSRKYFKN
jgi:hypothetical protein